MKVFKSLLSIAGVFIMSACSVFGDPGVEIAEYKVLDKPAENIEIRHYEELVLVSAPMPGGMNESDNEAFQKLFQYISGKNTGEQDIAMTAPVIMDDKPQGTEIEMTAPVFMNEEGARETMSFVLPSKFSFENAPQPLDPDVKLSKIEDYTVAAIIFSGFLNDANVQKHRIQLEEWLAGSNYRQTGPYQYAGYNPPWTLPFARRNEVLIPVEKK